MAKNPSDTFFWNDWDADPQLRVCSLASQGFWMRCLCIAARHDPKGYVAIDQRPLTWAELARCAGCAEKEARVYMDELLRAGVATKDSLGRVINRRMVRVAEISRKRSEAGKHGADVTNGNKKEDEVLPQQNGGKMVGNDVVKQTPSSILLSSNKNHDREDAVGFDEFWSVYPLKKSKSASAKAYRKARQKVSQETLLSALRSYVAECSAKGTFLAHASSWLNGERWLDEPAAQPAVQAQPSIFNEPDREESLWLARLTGFYERGFWSDGYGPKPGEDRCRCPPRIAEMYRKRREEAA